jgi:hypothetical protein
MNKHIKLKEEYYKIKLLLLKRMFKCYKRLEINWNYSYKKQGDKLISIRSR